MNILNNIAATEKKQELLSKLDQYVINKLPSTLEESAKEYGVLIRIREIKNALDLIKMMFIYAISNTSQKLLAVFASVLGIAKISDQAWHKKIAKSGPWLAHVLNKTLPLTKLAAKDKDGFENRHIKLVDGSCVKQAGTNGEVIRIHMCYDLTLGCMDEVSVTDQHTAESFVPFNITPGSIYMADAGFGKGKNLEYIVSRQADAIFRVTPNLLALASDAGGKEKIDMVEKLNTREDVVEFTCYVHTINGKYVPARLIANRLPEDKAAEAVKRKKRAAQKKQNVLKEETLVYAEWVILMTSLDEKYSAEDVLRLYRARWQIELLFKRIKQFFKVTRLRMATVQHSKVLVLLWLILWSVTERQVVAAEIYLKARQADMSRFSPWTMCGFFLHVFKSMLNQLWVFCFDIDTDLLDTYKRLCNHKARRNNQYFEFHFSASCSFSP